MYASGNANAEAHGIRLYLGFRLRFLEDGTIKNSVVPELELYKREMTMEELELTVDDNPMAWLINSLVSFFNEVLKSYVCYSLMEQLYEHTSWLCDNLNMIFVYAKPYLEKMGWQPRVALEPGVKQDDAEASPTGTGPKAKRKEEFKIDSAKLASLVDTETINQKAATVAKGADGTPTAFGVPHKERSSEADASAMMMSAS